MIFGNFRFQILDFLVFGADPPTPSGIFHFCDIFSLDGFSVGLNVLLFWREVLKKYCGKAFKKIRIKKRNKTNKQKIVELISNKKKEFSRNTDQKDIKEKIAEIYREIAEIEAFENRNKVLDFKSLSDNPESVNFQEM